MGTKLFNFYLEKSVVLLCYPSGSETNWLIGLWVRSKNLGFPWDQSSYPGKTPIALLHFCCLFHNFFKAAYLQNTQELFTDVSSAFTIQASHTNFNCAVQNCRCILSILNALKTENMLVLPDVDGVLKLFTWHAEELELMPSH